MSDYTPTRFQLWVANFPTSQAIVLVGILTYILLNAAGAFVQTILLFWPALRPPTADSWLLDKALRLHEQGLDASLWVMGVGGAAIVGKRATTKADVMQVEASTGLSAGMGKPVQSVQQTADAQVVAQAATPVSVASPTPIPAPVVAPIPTYIVKPGTDPRDG